MKIVSLIVYVVFIFYASAFAGKNGVPITDFRKADSVAALYPKHSLVNMKVLADKLTVPLATEEEKFRAIYKWVCTNIEYDYQLNVQNQQMRSKLKSPEDLREWNKKISSRTLKTLLTRQETVCSGYAYLVKELAFHADINCEVVDGYGRTSQANIRGTGVANHSWNVVQLHGTWYLCDPTWSSGAYDTQLEHYVMKYNDAYFLADPSLFIRNHYPLDSTWMLLEHKPTLHEFLNRPLIYVDAYTYSITPVYPETFDITVAKGGNVNFRFKSDSVVEKVNLLIKSPNETHNVIPFNSKEPGGLFSIDHVFSAKGIYIVHVVLDGAYVLSYEVKVK